MVSGVFCDQFLMGIMPVRQIGGVQFEEDTVTKELMKKYQDMVSESIKSHKIQSQTFK